MSELFDNSSLQLNARSKVDGVMLMVLVGGRVACREVGLYLSHSTYEYVRVRRYELRSGTWYLLTTECVVIVKNEDKEDKRIEQHRHQIILKQDLTGTCTTSECRRVSKGE